MSTFDDREVVCAGCQASFVARVYASVSTERMPEAPEWVLGRTFQRASCPACGLVNEVTQPVLYVDFVGGLWAHCLPVEERRDFEAHEGRLAEVFRTALAPPNAPPIAAAMARRLQRRGVFGHEELREKIVCQRAGLEDGLIECVKLEVLLQTPLMAEDGAVGLLLDAVEEEHLVFAPLFDALEGPPDPELGLNTVRVPRAVYAQVAAERSAYVRAQRSMMEGGYRNLLRYAFAQPVVSPLRAEA